METKNHRVTERVERCPTKKAYLRLSTTHGDLNIELHSDLAPRASENFLVLADKGYYTGTKFHRSIKNFMIQVRLSRCGRRRLGFQLHWKPAPAAAPKQLVMR